MQRTGIVLGFVLGAAVGAAISWIASPSPTPSGEAAARPGREEPAVVSTSTLSLAACERRQLAMQASLQSMARDLRDAQAEIAALERAEIGGSPAPATAEPPASAPSRRSPLDPTPADWRAYAAKGQIRYRLPCLRMGSRALPPAALERVGLTPQEGAILREAYQESNTRVGETLERVCGAALGSAELARRLLDNPRVGLRGCIDLVLEDAFRRDAPAAEATLRAVGRHRSGDDPTLAVAPDTPLVQLLDLLTGESSRMERRLAERIGPEQAARIMHDDALNQPGGEHPLCFTGDVINPEPYRR